MIEWCNEKWLFNQLSSEQTIYCQILHTAWYISGERLKEKIEVDHSWSERSYRFDVLRLSVIKIMLMASLHRRQTWGLILNGTSFMNGHKEVGQFRSELQVLGLLPQYENMCKLDIDLEDGVLGLLSIDNTLNPILCCYFTLFTSLFTLALRLIFFVSLLG